MRTVVNYGGGDETDEVFWNATAKFPDVYHEKVHRKTDWGIAKILEHTEDVSMKKMFSKAFKGKITTIVMELFCTDRDSCVLQIKSYGDRNLIFADFATGRQEDLDFYIGRVASPIPDLPDPEPEEDDGIFVDYTYLGPHGPLVHTREIAAPQWMEIQGNYPRSISSQLQDLIMGNPGDAPGKIAVLHGPPGTGKTFFLRALAREWADKAHFSYIIDAEAFFGDPGYMIKLLLGGNDPFDDEDENDEMWHVLICEDAEEFIADTAKQATGQALSRLLNLGDGMLGQGLRILFLFTTNVKKTQLHEAITRDGRCFLNAEIPAFSSTESIKWLSARGKFGVTVTGSKTLVELYTILRGEAVPDKSSSPVGGNYL